MPTELDQARIAEKVRRLLALAGSANEHEAAAAAAKAQELLHRHNLTMAEVKGAERPDYGRTIIDLDNSAGWRGVLLDRCATYNGGKLIFLGKGRYALIAQPHAVEVIQYLNDYLATTIERLADSEWRRFAGYAASSRRWKTGFRYGAVEGVAATMKAQAESLRTESASSTALVHVSDAQLAKAVSQFYPRLQKRSGPSVSASGLVAGRVAGAGIGINRGITGNATGPRRLLS